MSRDWRLFLNDIALACARVNRYTSGLTRSEFLSDEKTYDAVVRNLEIIGEAAKKIPPDAREKMPNIEWRNVAGMRDWLAHVYFGIDDDILWDVIDNRVAELEQVVRVFQSESEP